MTKTSPYEEIGEMGSEVAVPALIRVMESHDSILAEWHRQLHAKIPPGISRHLPPPADRQRILSRALTSLAQFGSDASPAVPSLIRLYQRRRPTLDLRDKVAATLGAMGSAASNAIPTLLEGFEPTNRLEYATAAALWRIDPTGDQTEAAFAASAKHPLRGTLAKAAADSALAASDSWPWGKLEVLGCVRSEAPRAVPAIVRLLQNENERYRAKAAEALGRLGAAAQEAAGEIRPLLADECQMVREAAANALIAIDLKRP